MTAAPETSAPGAPPAEIVVVAAVARNGVIGSGNELVFRDPADQRHFRATTIGSPVVMGRRTWLSLPGRMRPLPGRRNIVLTRDPGFAAPGAETAPTLDHALALARAGGAPRICIVGGAEVYAAALPLADTLVLTEVEADLEGDTRFPPWDRSRFVEAGRTPQHTHDGVRFDFVTYRRV